MDYESPQSIDEMVSSLKSRKEALETKVKEKNEELKALCIQEAELTGVLPPETPLEVGESPPVFRRRVGTAFTYPENLINNLKSKEEESLATLELEYNIQTGIAEAARNMANDTNVNKAARRKHRIIYQQSQRRILELEARLNLLRQASRFSLKQRKKPRPPDVDSVDIGNCVSLSPVQEKLNHHSSNHQVPERNNHVPLHNYNRNHQRPVYSSIPYSSPSWNYQQYSDEIDRHQRSAYHHSGLRMKGDGSNWYNTAPTCRYKCLASVAAKTEEEVLHRDRFGSLDRRRGGDSEVRQPPTILLPNQTYPENSLMRTQSLSTVDHFSRKNKEKDWFETSLDSGSRPSPSLISPASSPAHKLTSLSSTHSSETDSTEQLHLPISQQLSFDTVVPFESPKNHTVVQAGMWQPYREVTKPFEMADFYKYSTKFRKNSSGAPPVPQQKAVYQPLQPMSCQPVVQRDSGNEAGSSKVQVESTSSGEESSETLSWYQDQTVPQPHSATLV